MLGDNNAISGNALAAGQPLAVFYLTGQQALVSRGTLSLRSTVTLIGRQITVARGTLGFTKLFYIVGQQVNAYQDYFEDFQDLERLVGFGLVTHQGNPSRYQGFNMPNLLSLQARQGAIQIQKLIYNLGSGTAYFSENTMPVDLYYSIFRPDTDDRIAVVPAEDRRDIEILEEYRGMLVAPMRVGYP